LARVDGLLLDTGSTELRTAHSLFEVSLPQISRAPSPTLDFSFLIKQEPRPIHSRARTRSCITRNNYLRYSRKWTHWIYTDPVNKPRLYLLIIIAFMLYSRKLHLRANYCASFDVYTQCTWEFRKYKFGLNDKLRIYWTKEWLILSLYQCTELYYSL